MSVVSSATAAGECMSLFTHPDAGRGEILGGIEVKVFGRAGGACMGDQTDSKETRLHVFRQPAGGKGAVELVLDKSGSIAPLACPDRPVKIRQMLPPV